jgi:hypothetical protein
MSAAPQFAPAACSLAAVFIWGTSDFTGGYASRRANAFVFTAFSHLCALVLMVVLALAQHAPFPSRTSILWALLAGGIGGFSLAIFYRAPRLDVRRLRSRHRRHLADHPRRTRAEAGTRRQTECVGTGTLARPPSAAQQFFVARTPIQSIRHSLPTPPGSARRPGKGARSHTALRSN